MNFNGVFSYSSARITFSPLSNNEKTVKMALFTKVSKTVDFRHSYLSTGVTADVKASSKDCVYFFLS